MPPKRRTKVVKVRSVDMSEVERIVLWRHPITTLKHFFLELISIFINYGRKLIDHYIITLLVAIAVATFYFLSITEGPHEAYVLFLKKQTFWWAYWVGLGILSSIGLGTGLHTFLLYLGPFIAQVTLAAYECDSVDFPAPPYPDEIVCPTSATSDEISIWTIVNKVRWEAVMWGAGTALGELPPYFMARTSRLSGTQSENEQEIQQLLEPSAEDMQSFVFRIKRLLYILIQKIGFFGILVCASIPNPLFDLAGITCGHFLVPFWTFFGATLIGKSVIKVHIQEFFTIFLFSEHHVEAFVQSLRHIPYVGTSLQVPFREWLVKQKQQLHRPVGSGVHQETSLLSMIFSLFVGAMILFFVVSIINSLAQRRYRAQLVDQEQEKVK